MLFKTDENIHPDIAAHLRRSGHDAMTVWDQRLTGTPDGNLAEVCRAEGRALLTHDADFSDIRAYPPTRYAGLVVLRLTDQSRAATLAAVNQMLALVAREPLTGQLWIIEDHRIRIRPGE